VTRGHFDAIATRYDGLRSQLFEPALELLARAADLPGRRVLDLGCGTGRFAAALAARQGCTAFGVDPSPAMLAVARERAAGLPLELREGDARELELDEPAALIYVPFRSLLHLHGWHERRQVFEQCVAEGFIARRQRAGRGAVAAHDAEDTCHRVEHGQTEGRGRNGLAGIHGVQDVGRAAQFAVTRSEDETHCGHMRCAVVRHL